MKVRIPVNVPPGMRREAGEPPPVAFSKSSDSLDAYQARGVRNRLKTSLLWLPRVTLSNLRCPLLVRTSNVERAKGTHCCEKKSYFGGKYLPEGHPDFVNP